MTEKTAPRRLAPTMALSRERVIVAGADLANRQGAAQLTLAATAKELNASVPAILKHVRNLDDLRSSVAARFLTLLTERVSHAVMGRAGSGALMAAADAYRECAREHQGTYALAVATPQGGSEDYRQAGGRLVDATASILLGYGLAADQLTHSVRILRANLHGFVSLELSNGFQRPESVDDTWALLTSSLDAVFRSLGDNRTP